MFWRFGLRGAARSAEEIERLRVGLAIIDLEPDWDSEQVYRRGLRYAAAGDYRTAAVYLYKAAVDGYAVAQHYLGGLFEVGRGVESSLAEALKWYTLAAEQGLAVAQSCVAICYHKGRGVKRDYRKAVYWYSLAAEQGVSRAQYELAGLYAEGKGVEAASVECSVRWYIAAARNGHKMSQELLKSFKIDY